ncbi:MULTISPECIES: P-loop NTPase fold protein [Rhodococcus]|uniref:KAP family P-loop NTPase fold protein n=1 Tax=Rhodococcus TaxID=1827 RepID=UPI000BB15005|nr:MULTISPECIES: P-loop NTPase fold protein [Rhodococcus]PBC51749.1 hypothetical protein CJ177_35470 [Rhodococcus sp. ACPA1]QSE85796.1 hypothetical protein JWS14_42550 [Rhodococcus koreensis]
MTVTAPAHIFTDAPITDASGDRLDREEFSAHVAQRIAAMGGRDSVAFGLTGAWGSGKTSVLRMIADNMPTPEWSVHYFTPWAASDSATLVKEFYATIESALPTDVRKKMGGKLRAMVPLATGAASMIPVAGKAVSTLFEETGKYFEKSFQDQFKEASKDIVEAGIRILVVVDDIDRLHADELVAVLKTVRLLGNFPGIHYLLAYDQNTVLDVLSATSIAKNSDRALQFLEKIVQYPFDLPPLQQPHRVREMTTALAKVEATHSLGPILSGRGPFGSPVDDLLSLVPPGDLETLRAIHRLVTQFDITLTVIRPNEINATDLLFLTFLRVRYPRLYQKLPAWKGRLLRTGPVSTRSGEEPNWRAQIEEAAEVNGERADALARLVQYLFPAVRGPGWIGNARKQSVCKSAYFDRYFVMGIPVGDISDALIVAGLSELADTGQLADQSPLGMALADEQMAGHAAEKCCTLLPKVTASMNSANAVSAALVVSRRLLNFTTASRLSSESRFAGALAGIAVVLADTAESACAVLETFVSEWGLHVTIRTMSTSVAANTPTEEESEQIRAVGEDVHRRCFDACITDLTTDDSETGSVLFYGSYLGEDRLNELRNKVKEMIDGGQEVDRIAARFVSIYTAYSSESGPVQGAPLLGGFNRDEFEMVVPRQLWEPLIVERPEDREEINEDDASIENRVRRARQALIQAKSE